MTSCYHAYENKYLDNIKRTGFIQKLQTDLKLKNSSASRRLNVRLKKLSRRNLVIQNGGTEFPSFVDKKWQGRLKSFENVKKLNDLKGCGNEIYMKSSIGRAGICYSKLRTGIQTNIVNPLLTAGEQTKPDSIDKKLERYCEQDGNVKVALWLNSQSKLKYTDHYEDIYLNGCDNHKHQSTDNYLSKFTRPCDTDRCSQSNTDVTLLNPYAKKMSVFCVNYPDEFENVEGIRHNSTATGDDVIDVTKNVYNKYNYRIHTCIWCPCLLFFVFIFCIPAVIYMHKSDKCYHVNDLDEASFYGRISTVLYVCGLLAALLFYCALILFLVNFS
ncbi:uncharacterized protein LOC123547860 [Mercenaria mercenaria]|uniref:uncharacterized protein LOC123547860 n=1 Tax=Mercenaria mercenaria TaxID=6596 RepID=UPI00234E9269|nr:uncharacterized protein LOC123547860 [Mercenaria mercenaria]